MSSQNLQNGAIMKESIFIIGRVSSVEGRRVKVCVNKDKNLSHISYKGKIIKNVSVGSYVKISKGFIEIIGKVEGEYISREKIFNEEYKKEEIKIVRYLDVSLFGHFDGDRFKQGIKEMPLIDNECYLLDKNEFNKLHQFFGNGEKTIKIGTLTEEPSQEIKISIRKLFASHIGIFGNTGSGKSNTLAKVYSELFHECQSQSAFVEKSRFVLIDFNGEYIKDGMITTNKKVYNLTTRVDSSDKYRVKRENIERHEVISVLLEATEKTQKPFLTRALDNKFLDDDFENRSKTNIEKIVKTVLHKVDTNWLPVLTELFKDLAKLDISKNNYAQTILANLSSGTLKFFLNSSYYIGEKNGTGDGRIFYNEKPDVVFSAAFPNLADIVIDSLSFEKIKFKILSQYYHEIINGYSNPEHIRPLMGRMFKKFDMLSKIVEVYEDNSKGEQVSFEVINLKEVNLEMKKTLPLIICKQLYDEHKDSHEFDNRSLHIIVDEAHNILSSSSERESETWKDYRLETFEEIIKEGRKFSTFLTISSQRPYDISATIISQLHNYFIHRLINENDIKAIEKTIAYLDKLSFESIPVLSIGSCFVAGLASDIPVKVDIELLPLDRQPKSETINLEKIWFNNTNV